MEKLATEICAALAKHLGRPVTEVTPDKNLEEDLNMDSLDLAELMMDWEEQYNVMVAFGDLVRVQTVGDLVNCLAKTLDQSQQKLSQLSIPADARSYKVDQVAKKLTKMNLPATAAAELVDFFNDLDAGREK